MDLKREVKITRRYELLTRTGTTAEGYLRHAGERFPVRIVDWDDATEKAATLAANKNAGDWDLPQLSDWLKDLDRSGFDLNLTMFDPEEIAKLFKNQDKKEGLTEDEAVPEVPKTAKTKKLEIFALGAHRLICGSSTDLKTVNALMGEKVGTLLFTSPPYNLGKNAKLRGELASGKDSVYIETNDDKSQSEYFEFLNEFTEHWVSTTQFMFINLQMLAGNKIALIDYMHKWKEKLADVMIWDKQHGAPAMAENVLNSVWEFIFILSGNKKVNRSIPIGPGFHGTVPNIFRLNPIGKKDELAKDHGAVFPVAFAEYFIETFTKQKEIVIDPFGGSGTTLIACEKTKRKCYTVELDPNYCDVIIERWERFTGEKARKLSV